MGRLLARIVNIPLSGFTLLKMLAGREGELTGAMHKVAAFRTLLAKIKDAASLLTLFGTY